MQQESLGDKCDQPTTSHSQCVQRTLKDSYVNKWDIDDSIPSEIHHAIAEIIAINNWY